MTYEGANNASLQREGISGLLLYLLSLSLSLISISISIDCMECLAELCGENDSDAFLQAR
ncbi:hypothetical protein [Vibrio parahaemolyticus]|uniref:hypothetical protein n=1 Tax=Vibrio parahaemolyticus TaxID=670 RepID=UPI0015DDA030|nr:hypothetical protein [Vibrio parahaemolyticus]